MVLPAWVSATSRGSNRLENIVSSLHGWTFVKCRDRTGSLRCIWCEKAEPRQAVSNAIFNPRDMLSSKCKTRTCLQRHSVSPARRLDREMRRRLIIQEKRFFASYFIDVDTFYLFSTRVNDDQIYLSSSKLYACINTRKFKGIPEK